jgi:hypothetical protein
MKTFQKVCMLMSLACASMTLASCQKAKAVTLTAEGITTSVKYQEYTDLGGYGSDFTIFSQDKLSLYSDNSYVRIVDYVVYAGAWKIVASAKNSEVTGTYTTTSSDQYSVVAALAAATRVVSKITITSTVTKTDTNDVTTYTATSDKTAEAQQQEALAAYPATSAEIDLTKYSVTYTAA